MKTLFLSSLILSSLILCACQPHAKQPQTPALCSDAWAKYVESKIPTGDGMGHGPDIGSDEWRSVVEFKLGIRGNPQVPDRNSQKWCQYIDELLHDN
jgi:hypothetical protein